MRNINGFEIDVYNQHGIKEGATSSTCPKCSDGRTKKTEKCMSVFWDTGLGQCHHCGERVQLHTYKKKDSTKVYVKPPSRSNTDALSEQVIAWFNNERHIGYEVLKRLKIGNSVRWMPKAQKEIPVIEFRYFVFGELVNIKYRGKDKDFQFEKGCELVMYNLDAIMDEEECVIVEGEPDALAFTEAGVFNVTSVPNGFTLPKKNGESTLNLSYLDDYYFCFENKKKIYIAVDNDEAGRHGQRELIVRFGADKCWLVDFKDCKDANDYLKKYGKEALKKTLEEAKQVPLEYVETMPDFEGDLDNFYLNGSPKGFETGIKNLDDNFSVEFGQYVVVTGPPQSGKSELVDSMCLGYALRYGFKSAFASPENKPNHFHADKILRKIIGYKPFSRDHLNSEGVKRAKEFYKDHFYHVSFNDGFDLHKVLAKFEELVKMKGVKVFVIDPYNKVRLKTKTKDTNEYTREYLNEIDVFCKKNNCILILVPHPVKLQKEEGTDTYKMPIAYDIKGGGEFFDMSYHMLALVRDNERGMVRVKTLKVKFQHLGRPDVTFWLGWNINNGRYVSLDFDLRSPVMPTITWDNKDWLTKEPLKKGYEQADIFKQAKEELVAVDNKTLKLEYVDMSISKPEPDVFKANNINGVAQFEHTEENNEDYQEPPF
jgi:twinkle protein